MDEHGCFVYERGPAGYVGECSCRRQFRAATEPRLLREFYEHSGFINPHLKREIERQAQQ